MIKFRSFGMKALNEDLMACWRFKFYSEFQLLDPSGDTVSLPTRKVEGLCAILAANPLYGVSREELCEILWPNFEPDKQKANLRQTLAIVRKVVGSDNLETSADHCRFSDRFQFESDLDQPRARGFMPGMQGDWFDSFRNSPDLDASIREEPNSPVMALKHLLTWYAKTDPYKAIELMRDNSGMLMGLPYDDLDQLLRSTSSVSRHSSWHRFISADLMLAKGNIREASRLLRECLHSAKLEGDLRLSIRASAQLALGAILQNQFDLAKSASKFCLDQAEKTTDRDLKATAIQMSGNICLSAGDLKYGLQILEASEDQYSSYMDVMIMRAVRACHLSWHGLFYEAETLIQEPQKVASETGHAFFRAVSSLVKTNVAAASHSVEDLVPECEATLSVCESSDNGQLIAYANEILESLYLKVGLTEEAVKASDKVRQIRTSMNMVRNPGDGIRSKVFAKTIGLNKA